MRRKVLLKRMAAMGLAAAMTISSVCLPNDQVTVHAASAASPESSVSSENIPETETQEEQETNQDTETVQDTETQENAQDAETQENAQDTNANETQADQTPETETNPETGAIPESTEETIPTESTEETTETEDTENSDLTEDTEELAAAGTAFYNGTKTATSDPLETADEDWDNKKEIAYDESISGITAPENFTMTATVSLDSTSYALLSNGENYVKIQGVVKLGEDWSWNDSQDVKQLKKDSFTQSGSTYQTDISISFTDITPADLKGIYFEIVGKGFSGGTVSVSNVKLIKGEDSAPLPSQGPYTVDDFENAEVGTNAGWTKEEGYKYDGDVTTSVAALNGSNQLKCNAALYSRRKKHFIFDSINTITALSFL